jgi:hypothetical protein
MFRKIAEKIREVVSFQNLTKADGQGKFPWHARAWLHLSSQSTARVEYNIKSDFHHIGIAVDPSDGEIKAFIAFAPFAVWFALEDYKLIERLLPGINEREVSISAHNKCIYWSFWMDPQRGRSDEPAYRRGSFAWDDFVFGKQTIEREVIKATERVAIPMPEGVYLGNSTIERFTYRRPRARTLTKTMASVTMDPRENKAFKPIPVPGKGENDYDIDEDALYSMSRQVEPNATHADAVAEVVRSVLKTRWQRGGKNWRPEIVRTASAAVN